jgi:hypothetical protein
MWVTGPKRVSRDNCIAECGRYDEAYKQARKRSIRTHSRAFLGRHPHNSMPYCLSRAENRSPARSKRRGRGTDWAYLPLSPPFCNQTQDAIRYSEGCVQHAVSTAEARITNQGAFSGLPRSCLRSSRACTTTTPSRRSDFGYLRQLWFLGHCFG